MSDLLTLLAQQSDKQAFSKEVLFWLGAIVVAAVLLGFIALWLRKALTREVEPGPSLGFTLADLREMHAQGQLNDDEFEAAKAKMIARNRMEIDGEAAAKRKKMGYPDKSLSEAADAAIEEVQDLGDLSELDNSPAAPGEAVDNPEGLSEPPEADPDKNGGPPPTTGPV